MKYVGAAFDGQNEVIRVDPGQTKHFYAELWYSRGIHDAFSMREVRYEIEVHGALTGDTIDTITWRGELRLLQHSAGGWQLHADPLRLMEYTVGRNHGLDT